MPEEPERRDVPEPGKQQPPWLVIAVALIGAGGAVLASRKGGDEKGGAAQAPAAAITVNQAPVTVN